MASCSRNKTINSSESWISKRQKNLTVPVEMIKQKLTSIKCLQNLWIEMSWYLRALSRSSFPNLCKKYHKIKLISTQSINFNPRPIEIYIVHFALGRILLNINKIQIEIGKRTYSLFKEREREATLCRWIVERKMVWRWNDCTLFREREDFFAFVCGRERRVWLRPSGELKQTKLHNDALVYLPLF